MAKQTGRQKEIVGRVMHELSMANWKRRAAADFGIPGKPSRSG